MSLLLLLLLLLQQQQLPPLLLLLLLLLFLCLKLFLLGMALGPHGHKASETLDPLDLAQTRNPNTSSLNPKP